MLNLKMCTVVTMNKTLDLTSEKGMLDFKREIVTKKKNISQIFIDLHYNKN